MIPSSDPVAYLLKPLLAAVLLFGSAHVVGRHLSDRLGLGFHSRGERVAVCGALGLGLLGLAGLALGLAGGLHAPLVLLLLSLPILASLAVRRTPLEPEPRHGPGVGWVGRFLLSVVVIYAAANLVRALYPPTGFDALNYHLPAVQRYLEQHTLTFPTDLRFAAGPAQVPVLFALAASLGGDIAVQLVSFGMGLLTAAAVHSLACRRFGADVAAAATALFYTTPIVGWLSAEAYVDLGLVLFVAVALHGVLVRLDGGGAAWAWAAGMMAGAALGTRYLALAPVLILITDLVSAPAGHQGRRPRAKGLLLFAVAALLVASPWYARNVLESGDPVYPFLGAAMGEEVWTEAERADHAEYLRQVGPGRGLMDLVLVPFRVTFRPGAFGASGTTGVGYAYLFLVPMLLLVRRGGRSVRLLGGYALAGGMVWFFTSQQTRFLLPWLLALAVLGGLALDRMLRGRVHLPRGASAVLASVGLVLLVSGGTRWPFGLPPLGEMARDEHLRLHLPDYRRVERINAHLPEDAVLYAFGEEGRRYYYRGRTLGDWFGPTAYGRFLPEGDPRRLLAGLRRLGVTHLLVPDDFPDPALRGFRQQPFWWDHLVPVEVLPEVRLYRLVPDAVSGQERAGDPARPLATPGAESGADRQAHLGTGGALPEGLCCPQAGGGRPAS
jgi:hypothetical protein